MHVGGGGYACDLGFCADQYWSCNDISPNISVYLQSIRELASFQSSESIVSSVIGQM